MRACGDRAIDSLGDLSAHALWDKTAVSRSLWPAHAAPAVSVPAGSGWSVLTLE